MDVYLLYSSAVSKGEIPPLAFREKRTAQAYAKTFASKGWDPEDLKILKLEVVEHTQGMKFLQGMIEGKVRNELRKLDN